MHASSPEAMFRRLSTLIAEETGLHFAPERWRDLERCMKHAAKEFGFDDVAPCAEWLLASRLSRNEIETLASHLTVGETYFLRDKRLFEALEFRVLPDLIRARRASDQRLRIWSAGCCTGEEPYTLAVLLNRLIPDIREWNILLLATDINRRFLQKAVEGRYGSWSFRSTPPEFRDRYFRAVRGGEFEILPELKSMVTFSYLNLRDDVYPSLLNNTNALDIILCRNVLMYFDPACAQKAVSKLQSSLLDDGWLIVSPSEMSPERFKPLVTVQLDGALLYQKSAGETYLPAPPRSCTQKPATEDFLPGSWPLAAGESDGGGPSFAAGQVDEFSATVAESIPDLQDTEVTRTQTPYDEIYALYEQGRYDDAIRAIGAPFDEGDKDVPAKLRLLARIYANLGQLNESLKWIERAITLDRLAPANYYLRALIYREQGDVVAAANSLRQTLYLDSDFVVAHIALGDLARHRGNQAEAMRHWRIALESTQRFAPDAIVPESDGMAAGRFQESLRSVLM